MRVCYFNSTQAAVSPHEEEGLPSCKHARLSWPRGQRSTHRCRCACSHALLAARTPFPPRSAAFMHPLPRRCLRYGHSGRSTRCGRDADRWCHSAHAATAVRGRPRITATPQPPILPRLPYAQRTSAHARQRLRRVAGRRRCHYGARPALRDRAAACIAGLAVVYCPHSRTTP